MTTALLITILVVLIVGFFKLKKYIKMTNSEAVAKLTDANATLGVVSGKVDILLASGGNVDPSVESAINTIADSATNLAAKLP